MLMFKLEKDGTKPLYEQLYIGIKNAIMHQQVKVGAKLPAKRKLAAFLNISQTTVEIAYAQLTAEGYITARPRIGFFVEEMDALPYMEKEPVHVPEEKEEPRHFRYDFHPGKVDMDSFPFSRWRKYAKDIYDSRSSELLQMGDPQGEYTLRAEIASYLYQSRGIICKPGQIVIGSGTEHLLPMILGLFRDKLAFALENPGYSAIPRMHLHNQAISIPVDADGLVVDELGKTDANVVYITPSHQFPTGAVLSAARRTQLLKWAGEKENRYIIEDDYDSEFRYIGKPIPALLSSDQNNKVIYISTFTKSLMPSLRVAYFVLPPALLPAYKETFQSYASTVPRFDQHMLAGFMKDGHFAKHLNRMRNIYRKKHERLIQTLKTNYPQVNITGDQAGMHILISVPVSASENQLKETALAADIAVYPVGDYIWGPAAYPFPAFLIGFGGIPLDQIEAGIHQLMQCWGISRTKLV